MNQICYLNKSHSRAIIGEWKNGRFIRIKIPVLMMTGEIKLYNLAEIRQVGNFSARYIKIKGKLTYVVESRAQVGVCWRVFESNEV